MVSAVGGLRCKLAALVCVGALACGDSDDEGGARNPDQPDAQVGEPDAQVGEPDAQLGLPDAQVKPPDDLVPSTDTFFRADSLKLLAPKMYLTVFGFPVDATSQAQTLVDGTLEADDNADGFVDLSMLFRFLSTDPKAADGEMTTGGGLCPFPVMPTSLCQPQPAFAFHEPALAYTNGTDCALEGSAQTAPGACFSSAQGSLTMALPFVGAVVLEETRVVGSWDGEQIKNGYVRGFLPRSVAEATKVPKDVPAIVAAGAAPGTPLSTFLSQNDLTQNSQGVDGWWFLISFSAQPAKFGE